ncbi:MAG TPA: exodeoxyribonuclease VII small subunit [Pseudoneobacillus sp.]|nr:exodeoxyribonuclease VII small subunit [Pseudoneobacillus sp.]
MTEKETLTFEDAIQKLEIIVERLEEGDVPLEEAIEIYKDGMSLSKLCQDKLKYVEEQLAQMLTEDGKTVPFSMREEE